MTTNNESVTSLIYSPVDYADISLLIKVLNLENKDSLKVTEELKQRNVLELKLAGGGRITSRKAIYIALDQVIATTTNSNLSVHCSIDQWLDFLCHRIIPELKETKDLESIFAPLQAALARRTFIADTSAPSIADWALFAALFTRLKAMSLSMSAKYYRLVRWISHLQHIYLLAAPSVNVKVLDKEVSPFVPAVFDMTAMRNVINGTSIAVAAAATTGNQPAVNGKNKKNPAASDKTKSALASKNSTEAPSPVPCHPLARVDLRVGRILKVEKHPSADRLYVETVEFGEATPRTVVSGLVEHVSLEDLQDRLCMFICNLKPATLCKVVSSAMLLVSKCEDGSTLYPLTVPPHAKPGQRISIQGIIPQPDVAIKPKDTTWEDVKIDLRVINGIAHYQSTPLQLTDCDSAHITCEKVPNGIIS